ncbi:MAG: putative alpha/beta hydrolase [Acidimicrobiaceae bacterium]|nr:putative alpha/beta hydrolase [Acidimicrobiaceae bacterium]
MTLEVLPEPEGCFVTTSLGVRFHYHDLGRTPPDAGADAAVFLHGGGPGCSAWTDFGQVSRLFAADRRCLLVDLLQYGRTDKVTVQGPMWDFHSRHYLALLDSLGLDGVDLVCNSWGGSAALAFAAAYPERTHRLVITGSMPVFYGPLAPLPDRGARGRNARDDYYGGDGPSREKMRQLIARLEWFDEAAIPEATVTTRYEQSLDPEERAVNDEPARRGEWQDLTDRLGSIEAPTLFCWGMHDAFLTPDYPLMLASRLPRGQLYVMDRASHHLQEERPEEYHRMVSAFLDLPEPCR